MTQIAAPENANHFNVKELQEAAPFNDLILILNGDRFEAYCKDGDAKKDLEARVKEAGARALPRNSFAAKYTGVNPNTLSFSLESAKTLAEKGAAIVFDREALNGLVFNDSDGAVLHTASKKFDDKSHFKKVCSVLDKAGAKYVITDPTMFGGTNEGAFEVRLVGERDAAVVALSGATVVDKGNQLIQQFAPGIDAEKSAARAR